MKSLGLYYRLSGELLPLFKHLGSRFSPKNNRFLHRVEKVRLDALHTQDETARALVLEHGADYLLTVKANQPTVHE